LEKIEKVYRFLSTQAKVALLFDEIAIMLEVPQEEREELMDILEDLAACGMVTKTRKGRYLAEGSEMVSGKYQRHEQGFGFVLVPEGDVFIPLAESGGAMHGDVVVAIYGKVQSGRRREGRIVRILQRANPTVVGIYKNGRVVPDNRRIGKFLTIENADDSFENQKVVAKIKNFDTFDAEVIVALGLADSNDAQIKGIMHDYNIPYEFEKNVEDEAERLAMSLPGDEAENRRDLRGLLTITIDGQDAKDLDDAISLEILENGAYRLYVHIADVSHYVKYKSGIDKEALRRGTSCYLPDRVSPMLPKALSNGICSLTPGEDRLALTTIMEIDRSGRVADYEILETVINSNYRMTYEAVTVMLEDEYNPLWDKYKEIKFMLFKMLELSKIMRLKRFKNGSIEFNIPEAKVLLDENGKAQEIALLEHTISHKIIEEFMLACNRTVAGYANNIKLPFVYRVHEEPDKDKIGEVLRFISTFGYKLGGKVTGKKINDLLFEIQGKKGERVINTLMLRSQMKAKYSPYNDGHFGLGASFYCHFTSPIRRYPDLWCHRMVKTLIKGGNYYKFENEVLSVANLSTEREDLAANAERDAVRYKMCEYMESHIGEEFEATVSSVTGFGYFAELDNTVEGLIRVADMEDDYYVFDEKTLTLTGERRGKTIRIGDRVKVLVAAVDKPALRIDFVPGGM
jgi:ribonuclease R